LPGTPSLEKEGTFTSTERRVQRLYEVFPPLLGCRPDWQIIQDVANALGAKWDYAHPSDVMDEIASVSPIMAGVSYERLEGYKSLQWPVAADGSDQPLLYTKAFAFPDGKARLYPVTWSGTVEAPTAEYDLHLNNGRLLEHFHEGTMTYRTEGIREKVPDVFLEVSPTLAEDRGIQSGTWVKLVSKYGEVRIRALVTDRVRGHELYMPMNSTEIAVNRLTSSHADPFTHTPAYKDSSVNMTVLPEVGQTPLPPTNWRTNGSPTPQNGVEVQRKWAQPGYRMPGSGNGLVQIQRRNGHEAK
jgi:formate dehydrogenase major subunit